jgi:small ligand-binding sensory domain FIST
MELPSVWHRTDIESAACAGLVLRGTKRPTLRVTHGFRPESGPHRVTRSQGLWVAELDGRPALDVYREAVPEPLRTDPEWAGRYPLLAALCAGPEPPAEWPREQVLVRRLAGIDEARGAISLPEAVEVGRQVGFVQRDSELARRDLEHQLSGLDGGAGAFGFYLTCATRGETLFGAPGAEAELVRQIVPEAPLLGILGAYQLFSPGELAPASLLTHSAVLALLPG